MASAKIEVEIGPLKFSGEGEQAWLSQQLDKIIKEAQSLSALKVSAGDGGGSGQDDPQPGGSVPTLATHIKNKGGESNQNQRFLATSDWLRLRKQELTTRNVSKALVDHHQKKIKNAAESLNQNVKKGFCEKTAKGYFITPEGLKHLGYR